MASRVHLLGWGVGGLALATGGALAAGRGALDLLVPAWLMWGGLSLGAVVLLLVHRVTGGHWGEVLGPALGAAAAALPVGVALVVLALALPSPLHDLADAAFVARAAGCLALWLVLVGALGAFGAPARWLQGQGPAGLALLVLVVTLTVAAFDWVMALEHGWHSAVLGLLVAAAHATAALALAALWLAAGDGPGDDERRGAGALLLACLLLWAYLALMQFLTIWVANLPHEISWYLPRLKTGWRWLGLALVLLQLLALVLLLWPRGRGHRLGLGSGAALVLLAQALYALWLTLPSLRPDGPRLTLAELAVLVGSGGPWLALFLRHRGAAKAAHGR